MHTFLHLTGFLFKNDCGTGRQVAGESDSFTVVIGFSLVTILGVNAAGTAEAAVVGGENGLISAFFTGADEVSLKRLGRTELTASDPSPLKERTAMSCPQSHLKPQPNSNGADVNPRALGEDKRGAS